MRKHPPQSKARKDEFLTILLEKLEDHIKTNKIPHISTFIADNMELAKSYGYKAFEQFLYDNEETSSLLRFGKHKRISNLLNGSLSGELVPSVGIFALKQDGFRDNQDQVITSTINIENDLSKMSVEDLRAAIRQKI